MSDPITEDLKDDRDELIDRLTAAEKERDEARAVLAAQEQALTFEQTCLGCAKTLAGAMEETRRAERAEAERDAARAELAQAREEFGIRVDQPHPVRREKAGDIRRLSYESAIHAPNVWPGWTPVMRRRLVTAWVPLPAAPSAVETPAPDEPRWPSCGCVVSLASAHQTSCPDHPAPGPSAIACGPDQIREDPREPVPDTDGMPDQPHEAVTE